jgi:nucleoside-diphosphate-sugar epimerase
MGPKGHVRDEREAAGMRPRVLITGAAGNLGGFLARRLLDSDLALRLMVHRSPLADDLRRQPRVEVVKADLADPATLEGPCRDVDCIVHFAGVLFAPRPERFLPTTNHVYVRHLVEAARAAGVKRFILISFPHVEGPTTPERPASGRIDAVPVSVHAQTRLAAERALFTGYEGPGMEPIVLRVGTVYGRGVLMFDAARWLMSRRLLGVWRQPTWYHCLALPDFLRACEVAIRIPDLRGVFGLGDDRPLTLQSLLDRLASHWGVPRPWRAPEWAFFAAAGLVERLASVLGTSAPLTRDFIRIGMVPHVIDTRRMRARLLPELRYPTLDEGLVLL